MINIFKRKKIINSDDSLRFILSLIKENNLDIRDGCSIKNMIRYQREYGYYLDSSSLEGAVIGYVEYIIQKLKEQDLVIENKMSEKINTK